MRAIIHGLMAWLAALACLTILPTIAGRIPIPNLVLIGVGLAVLSNDRQIAWTWAIIGGLTFDLALPGRPFYTLFFVVFVLLVSFAIDRWNIRPNAILFFIGALSSSLALVLLEWFIAGRGNNLAYIPFAFASDGIGYLLGYAIVRSRHLGRPRPAQIG